MSESFHSNGGECRPTAEYLERLLPTVIRSLFGGMTDPVAALPLAQLKVCSILSDGPRSMSDLGRELHVTLSAMTQIADRLERAGLVMRIAENGDRRVRLLQLTDEAAEMMAERRNARIERTIEVLEQIGPNERGKLLTGLEALHRACDETHRNGSWHAGMLAEPLNETP